MMTRRRFPLWTFVALFALAGCAGRVATLAPPSPPPAVAAPSLGAGACAIYRSWNTGDTLTASDLTQSMTTVGVTNMTPQCLDDYSSDVTQMRATTDPYPAGVASLATTAAGELERLRYVLKTVFGWTQWYAHSEDLDFGTRNVTTTGTISGATLPRSYLAGYTLANNGSDATNDIDVAAGAARDSGNTADITLAAALTKQTDVAWAVGTNQGCLDTGAVGNNTYHLYAIKRADTGVVDVLCSLSASAPTMPTNYTLKRGIGAIVRAGGTILAFTQDGDLYQLSSPVLDHNATAPGTSAVTVTLASVPTGVNVVALVNASISGVSNAETHLYLSDLATTDVAATPATGGSLAAAGATVGITGSSGVANGVAGQAHVRTNTSAQIRARANGNIDANTRVGIVTLGWIHPRGRND